MTKRTKAAVLGVFLTCFTAFAEFDPCKINFGTDWDFLNSNRTGSVATAVDYVTIWLNDPSFNSGWHGSMVNWCKANNKTPVFYAYIIAKSSALGDADVGGALATKGANYIRSSWSNVKSIYENYASNVASRFGTDKPVIWLMEPDYFQYSAGSQEGGGLSWADLGSKMSELMNIVASHLPNALFSIDISPWNNDQAGYLSNFDLDRVTFLCTSGGRTEAGNTRIRTDNNNNVTWAGASTAAGGKGIIADDGYGVGGGSTGHDPTWDDVNNLKARIADGVVAITQKSPNTDWGTTIATLRTQLANESTKSCGAIGTRYTLTINATGGTVTKDKSGNSFSEGTVVTLTATPAAGNTFSNWSGDVSGTNPTTTVTMNSNKTVTAVFSSKPANTFIVDVTVVGTGTVTKSPDQPYYNSGTQVTLTAIPANGISVFQGWSGGASGSSMTVNVSGTSTDIGVTATFNDTAKADTIKVEAESFTSKQGDAIIIESGSHGTNIGYIESGNSTTYSVNVEKAGEYKLIFRVATGEASGSFGVSVDGASKGTVSFSGTGDNNNWHQYLDATLNTKVALTPGNHTVQLNYQGPINVDYFMMVVEPTIGSVVGAKARLQLPVMVTPVAGGFNVKLPYAHKYQSFSLFDFTGRLVRQGAIKTGSSGLHFSALTRDIWILRLEGVNGMETVRAAVIR